jgi:hypothetical protein
MTEPSQGPGEGEHGYEGYAALQQVHDRQRLRADAVENSASIPLSPMVAAAMETNVKPTTSATIDPSPFWTRKTREATLIAVR